MKDTKIPVLHVDGSLIEYVDDKGFLCKVGGIGGYLVVDGKISSKFSRKIDNIPYINHHEEYAVIEGLKWAKSQNIKSVKIKTDSMYAVNLFSHQKRAIHPEDKFFLVQYIMLEYLFDYIDIEYHSRSEDDLSHNLSRNYMRDLPADVRRLHVNNPKGQKNKKQEFIQAEEFPDNNRDLRKIVCKSVSEISHLITANA